MDSQRNNEGEDFDLEGPVRLRRNKSNLEVNSQQNTPTAANSGSLTIGGAGTNEAGINFQQAGPVSRSPRFAAGPGGSAFGVFKPNFTKALASETKKVNIDGVKTKRENKSAVSVVDIGDLINSSLGRQTGDMYRTQPGVMSSGGAMDAMNIRGAQRPRKQANTEMNVRAFHEHNRLMERRRQQLNASKDEKSGIGLTDLAFIEDGAAYPPIVVPYLMSEDTAAVETTPNAKSSRGKFTTKFVDESNRKAGHLLFSQLLESEAMDEEAQQQDVEWFLMQFPWRLPEGPGSAKSVADLPSGRIGEIVVRQSGRVELILEKMESDPDAAIKLDVNVGAESAFHQEVASYDMKNNELVTLGNLTKRMVLTPQMNFCGGENALAK